MIEHLINKVSKGVISDVDNSIFPNNAAYKFENAQITSKDNNYVVTTVEGNRYEFDIPEGLLPIAFKEYLGVLYIISKFTHNGDDVYEIGSYPSPKLTEVDNPNTGVIGSYIKCYMEQEETEYEDIYRPLPAYLHEEGGTNYILGFSSKKIEFNHENIDIIARGSYDGSIELFICDGTNYNRAINNGFNGQKIGLKRLLTFDSDNRNIEIGTRQFLSSNMPVYSDYTVSKGGELPYGRLVFYMRYLDASFNFTNFVPIGFPVQVSYGSKYSDISGGNPENDIPTDKQVTFNLRNLDTAFKYFEVAVFYERGLAGTTDPIKKSYLISNKYDVLSERELVITGKEEQIVITPEELLASATSETISSSHTSYNRRWFGSGMKRKEFDYTAIKELAKRIYLKPTLDTSETVLGDTKDYDDPFLFEFTESDLLRYQDPKFPTTFYPGESAAFALVALLDDGTYSKPYPITGYNNYSWKKNFPGLGIVDNTLRHKVIADNPGVVDYTALMESYLSNDENTNQGLYQFPIFNTSLSDELLSYSPDSMRYPLAMSMVIEHAQRYYRNNAGMFENIKGFRLVRTKTEKNALYMGMNYKLHDRFVFSRQTSGGTNNYLYIKFGRNLFNSSYYNTSFDHDKDEENNYFPSSTPFSLEVANAIEDTSLGAFDLGFAPESKSMGHPNVNKQYALYSDDFIYSLDRPLNDLINYVIGKPFLSLFENKSELLYTGSYFPWNTNMFQSKPYGTLASGGYYPLYNGICVNVEKDIQNKNGYYTAIGDPLLSNDLLSVINDSQNPQVLSSTSKELGIRNLEVRTSPYIGIEFNLPYGTEWFNTGYEYLLIHKIDPLELYNNRLKQIEETEFLNYYICSESFMFNLSGYINQYLSNGVLVEQYHKLIYGDAFLSRSFVRTKYNSLFENYNYRQYAENEYYSDSIIENIRKYVQRTHELLSFPCYTWNNSQMRCNHGVRTYPYGLHVDEDKKKYLKGNFRDKETMGVEPILDATYNRTYLPNEFLRYKDHYKETFNYRQRVRYTAQYEEVSYIDNWRYSPAIQYQDYDASIGFITGIVSSVFGLFLIFENGILELFSDKREIQQSDTGVELTIGIGGILEKTYRTLTKSYGSQQNVYAVSDSMIYGCSYKHDIIWGITSGEKGVYVNDLTESIGISSLFKRKKAFLSTIQTDIGINGSKMMVEYSAMEKRAYFLFYDRKTITRNVTILSEGFFRIETDDDELLGRDMFYGRIEGQSEYISIEILPENVGEGYIDVYIPNTSSKSFMITIFKDNGFTLIFDEKINGFYESTNSPNIIVGGDYLREMLLLPDSSNNEIYIKKDAEPLEFFNVRHEMRVGVIINGAQSEKGLGSVQKMFMSSLVTSSEDVFFKAIFETEFQRAMLFPFYNESRFWMLPEYAENKWEFNHPTQTSDERAGYEEDAQMRGIWLMMELHYRGMYKKYINEIITKVSPSYS